MYERHGYSQKDRLYRIWSAMRQRCYSPSRASYSRYGGRGITVCDEWNVSFDAFKDWAISKGYRHSLSIDRINGDGNYCPENCRWATAKQQNQNKRFAKSVEIDGVTKSVAAWGKATGINLTTLYRRYDKGVRGRALIAAVDPTLRVNALRGLMLSQARKP